MRLLTARYLTPKEREIEAEYREPFGLVLRGFAAMGYSKSEVAGVLGWNRQDFLRRTLPRYDPGQEIDWPGKGEGRAQQEQAA